jgi:uncharacterized protein (TIGR02266 family)
MSQRGSGRPAGNDCDPSSENRRRDARYSLEAEVTLESDHNFYQGLVENLSVSGVFIATYALRHIGELVEFSLRLGDTDDVLQGIGEVRWIRQFSESSDTPPGMGLRFVELTPESRAKIDQFLKGRAPLFFDDDAYP